MQIDCTNTHDLCKTNNREPHMESRKRPDINFVWNITDNVLRDAFKKNEIGDVMLPFVVIRRMDCVLAPVNEQVRSTYKQFKDRLEEERLEPILQKTAGGLKFYNTSSYTLTNLLDDASNIELNFNSYLNGFNKGVRSILEHFVFEKVVARLNRNRLLYQMIQAISSLDFSPETIDNHDMGYVFEELIRISNEQSNETAGEHFTPRDVIRLMSSIMFTPDKDILNKNGIIRSIYDPTCGTGGMVNLGSNYIFDHICDEGIAPTINTYGQELNEQSYAIAKCEALVTGENADNIQLGNTLTNDKFIGKRFHYMMANPPYGVTWKNAQAFVEAEACNPNGRFWAGLPRVSDGQLLFLQHMISKMENPDNGGCRIGVVTNGSPLFSGNAGGGESNIRKWIIENDWLECIVALPKDLFYNTGIATYVWFLTNRKSPERKGKVQLINAVEFCKPVLKSLGNKRNEILPEHIEEITKLYIDFKENKYSKVYTNKFFGFVQLAIEQPLREENGKLTLKRGEKQSDPSKRDTENVPLTADINKFFSEDILPHIDPESWIDLSKSKIGYEINFTRYFYEFQELESAESLKGSILNREETIIKLIKDIFA